MPVYFCFGTRWVLVAAAILFFSPLHSLSGQDIYDTHEHPDTLHITIAAEPDYPPFSFINEDGEPDGLSIEVFRKATAAVNVKYEIRPGIWGVIKKDLAEGRIDALPFVGRTPEREADFDFTMSYLSLHGDVFVHKKNKTIRSLDDLRHKCVAVMKGDNAEEYVRRDSIAGKIITTATFEDAFRLLSRGECDAVITQRITGLMLLDEMGLKSVVALDLFMPEFRQDFCFAVTEGDEALRQRLNEGLSVIMATGTYEKIQEKWLGDFTDKQAFIREVVRKTLSIAIPLLILILVIFVFFLRHRVAVRTRKLKSEILEHRKTSDALQKQNRILREMEKISLTGGWEYTVSDGSFNWTEGVYDIYGVSREEYNTSDFLQNKAFYHPEDQDIINNAFQKLISEGVSYELELRFRSLDGKDKWVRTSAYPEYNDGKIVKAHGNIMDITRQKKTEQELQQFKTDLEKEVVKRTAELEDKVRKLDRSEKAMLYMVEDLNELTASLKEERRKLEESNRELESFSYSVSHDLRAPLRAINGYINFLDEDYSQLLDQEGLRLLSVIRENAGKMDRLILELLSLSRVSRAELRRVWVNMGQLARAVYHDIATEQEKKDFDFILEETADVYCDTTLMKQVWQNLISNALKYSSKSDQKEIRIRCESDRDMFLCSISDRGAGFDVSYKDKLFGVFQRLHREDEFEGIGVGLAIVQRIIHRHEGEVWAEGKPGEGATFYFKIPTSL